MKKNKLRLKLLTFLLTVFFCLSLSSCKSITLFNVNPELQKTFDESYLLYGNDPVYIPFDDSDSNQTADNENLSPKLIENNEYIFFSNKIYKSIYEKDENGNIINKKYILFME